MDSRSPDLPRLRARALARLRELRQEREAILAEFPELQPGAGHRRRSRDERQHLIQITQRWRKQS